MNTLQIRFAPLLAAALLATAAPAAAEQCGPGSEKHLLWGDLHVHTTYSLDAYLFGVGRTPTDAYEFARGAADVLADGSEARLDRPLDFAAVTDHAEYLAATALCGSGYGSADCRELNAALGSSGMDAFRRLFAAPLFRGEPICPADSKRCTFAADDAWQRIQQAAAAANDPCHFTTFVGSEWSATPNALHWHRNLIFAGATVPAVPPNVVDQPTQEDLWRALERGCRPEEGCRVLAIPHNSNIGMGGTFRIDENDLASLRLRSRYERLAEVFQHKGQSECFPGSTLTDEACAFEIMLPVPVMVRQAREPGPLTETEKQRTASGYLRNALGEGLAVSARTGINPFRYGLVGSTDTHTARPGYVAESGWAGAFGSNDDTPEERAATPYYNPGGLVAVWAEENTRSSIFGALERREAYATSGPRIALRFQQTFDAELDLCGAQPAAVPMGGTLQAGQGAPRFAVHAMMDRRPLARIDIVKLAYRNGKIVQHIESRTPEQSGGARDWCIEWRDADYRPDEPALWYARVLEVPRLRWSAAEEPKDSDWIQERAWSSPIWSMPDTPQREQ